MTEYKRIGIDTSKAVFTLHGIDQQDRPVLRINLRRPQLLAFFRKLLPTEVAMLVPQLTCCQPRIPFHLGGATDDAWAPARHCWRDDNPDPGRP
jgi:hypothetical protein